MTLLTPLDAGFYDVYFDLLFAEILYHKPDTETVFHQYEFVDGCLMHPPGKIVFHTSNKNINKSQAKSFKGVYVHRNHNDDRYYELVGVDNKQNL